MPSVQIGRPRIRPIHPTGPTNLWAGNREQAREWLERAIAHTLELGFKEVMAYALATYTRLCLHEDDPERAAYLAGIADGLLRDAGLELQPQEQVLFEGAKATAQERLGQEYAAIHDAAMDAPLEEALRQGSVLAETPASP